MSQIVCRGLSRVYLLSSVACASMSLFSSELQAAPERVTVVDRPAAIYRPPQGGRLRIIHRPSPVDRPLAIHNPLVAYRPTMVGRPLSVQRPQPVATQLAVRRPTPINRPRCKEGLAPLNCGTTSDDELLKGSEAAGPYGARRFGTRSPPDSKRARSPSS